MTQDQQNKDDFEFVAIRAGDLKPGMEIDLSKDEFANPKGLNTDYGDDLQIVESVGMTGEGWVSVEFSRPERDSLTGHQEPGEEIEFQIGHQMRVDAKSISIEKAAIMSNSKSPVEFLKEALSIIQNVDWRHGQTGSVEKLYNLGNNAEKLLRIVENKELQTTIEEADLIKMISENVETAYGAAQDVDYEQADEWLATLATCLKAHIAPAASNPVRPM